MSWSAAHKHFLGWCSAGTWTKVLTAIRGEIRTRSGRRRRPTAAVVDSSLVKASPVAGPTGFDGAIDGIKRHVLVDSAGILVVALVTEADVQDRAASRSCCARLNVSPRPSRADKGYTGSTIAETAAKAGVSVEIVSGPKPGHGFIVQPRR